MGECLSCGSQKVSMDCAWLCETCLAEFEADEEERHHWLIADELRRELSVLQLRPE